MSYGFKSSSLKIGPFNFNIYLDFRMEFFPIDKSTNQLNDKLSHLLIWVIHRPLNIFFPPVSVQNDILLDGKPVFMAGIFLHNR